MSHSYKMTKNPKTHKFEHAAWLDVGPFYYVAFPDGSMYNEKYCVWEFQEVAVVEEGPPPLEKTA